MSPTENPGSPCRTDEAATKISGMLVITDITAKPTGAPLRRVSSINLSIDFIVNWLATAKIANEKPNAKTFNARSNISSTH